MLLSSGGNRQFDLLPLAFCRFFTRSFWAYSQVHHSFVRLSGGLSIENRLLAMDADCPVTGVAYDFLVQPGDLPGMAYSATHVDISFSENQRRELP